MAGITTPRSAAYDALLSTTLDRYWKSGALEDAVFNSNPTFAAFKEKGRIQMADGGYQIAVNLMYGQNTTAGPYSRYEVLDVAPQDGITQAFYPWAQYAVSVSIDGLSEFQNSGAGKIVDLVSEKVDQATMTLGELLNQHLLDRENVTLATGVTSNSGKAIIGLPLFIHVAPTTSHVIGGITCDTDAPTNAWWGNQVYTPAADSFIGLTLGMARIYDLCTKGSGGAPDLIISDMLGYEIYEAAMDDKKRYLKYDNTTAGFPAVYYKTAKMFWDAHMPDAYTGVNWDSSSFTESTMYFINSKFMKLVVGKGRNFKPTGFQKPEDQDARVSNILLYGQLVCSNRRKQGVLHSIEQTIAS